MFFSLLYVLTSVSDGIYCNYPVDSTWKVMAVIAGVDFFVFPYLSSSSLIGNNCVLLFCVVKLVGIFIS